jgi:hypothetical protein
MNDAAFSRLSRVTIFSNKRVICFISNIFR